MRRQARKVIKPSQIKSDDDEVPIETNGKTKTEKNDTQDTTKSTPSDTTESKPLHGAQKNRMFKKSSGRVPATSSLLEDASQPPTDEDALIHASQKKTTTPQPLTSTPLGDNQIPEIEHVQATPAAGIQISPENISAAMSQFIMSFFNQMAPSSQQQSANTAVSTIFKNQPPGKIKITIPEVINPKDLVTNPELKELITLKDANASAAVPMNGVATVAKAIQYDGNFNPLSNAIHLNHSSFIDLSSQINIDDSFEVSPDMNSVLLLTNIPDFFSFHKISTGGVTDEFGLPTSIDIENLTSSAEFMKQSAELIVVRFEGVKDPTFSLEFDVSQMSIYSRVLALSSGESGSVLILDVDPYLIKLKELIKLASMAEGYFIQSSKFYALQPPVRDNYALGPNNDLYDDGNVIPAFGAFASPSAPFRDLVDINRIELVKENVLQFGGTSLIKLVSVTNLNLLSALNATYIEQAQLNRVNLADFVDFLVNFANFSQTVSATMTNATYQQTFVGLQCHPDFIRFHTLLMITSDDYFQKFAASLASIISSVPLLKEINTWDEAFRIPQGASISSFTFSSRYINTNLTTINSHIVYELLASFIEPSFSVISAASPDNAIVILQILDLLMDVVWFPRLWIQGIASWTSLMTSIYPPSNQNAVSAHRDTGEALINYWMNNSILSPIIRAAFACWDLILPRPQRGDMFNMRKIFNTQSWIPTRNQARVTQFLRLVLNHLRNNLIRMIQIRKDESGIKKILATFENRANHFANTFSLGYRIYFELFQHLDLMQPFHNHAHPRPMHPSVSIGAQMSNSARPITLKIEIGTALMAKFGSFHYSTHSSSAQVENLHVDSLSQLCDLICQLTFITTSFSRYRDLLAGALYLRAGNAFTLRPEFRGRHTSGQVKELIKRLLEDLKLDERGGMSVDEFVDWVETQPENPTFYLFPRFGIAWDNEVLRIVRPSQMTHPSPNDEIEVRQPETIVYWTAAMNYIKGWFENVVLNFSAVDIFYFIGHNSDYTDYTIDLANMAWQSIGDLSFRVVGTLMTVRIGNLVFNSVEEVVGAFYFDLDMPLTSSQIEIIPLLLMKRIFFFRKTGARSYATLRYIGERSIQPESAATAVPIMAALARSNPIHVNIPYTGASGTQAHSRVSWATVNRFTLLHNELSTRILASRINSIDVPYYDPDWTLLDRAANTAPLMRAHAMQNITKRSLLRLYHTQYFTDPNVTPIEIIDGEITVINTN